MCFVSPEEAEVDLNFEVLFTEQLSNSARGRWPLDLTVDRAAGGFAATRHRSADPAAADGALVTMTMQCGGGLRCQCCKLVAAQLSVTSVERENRKKRKKEKKARLIGGSCGGLTD